jgi:hypothetical protein
MSFQKQGAPQPFKISSGLCEICAKKQGLYLMNGKMVCEDCKQLEEEESKNG